MSQEAGGAHARNAFRVRVQTVGEAALKSPRLFRAAELPPRLLASFDAHAQPQA